MQISGQTNHSDITSGILRSVFADNNCPAPSTGKSSSSRNLLAEWFRAEFSILSYGTNEPICRDCLNVKVRYKVGLPVHQQMKWAAQETAAIDHNEHTTHMPTCCADGVRFLENCPGLQELDLSETSVTSASLPVIANMWDLRTLNLSRTAVRTGIDQLTNLRQLETFGLASLGSVDERIPAESLSILSEFKRLQLLELSETAVSV